MPCGSSQPAADSLWVFDAVDVLEETQPGPLHNIGRVALRKLEIAGNRPEKP